MRSGVVLVFYRHPVRARFILSALALAVSGGVNCPTSPCCMRSMAVVARERCDTTDRG